MLWTLLVHEGSYSTRAQVSIFEFSRRFPFLNLRQVPFLNSREGSFFFFFLFEFSRRVLFFLNSRAGFLLERERLLSAMLQGGRRKGIPIAALWITIVVLLGLSIGLSTYLIVLKQNILTKKQRHKNKYFVFFESMKLLAEAIF